MQYLTLTSEVSQPFVIPQLSPVSPSCSRKNSTVDKNEQEQVKIALADIDEKLLNTENAIVDAPVRPRAGSLTLL